LGRLWANIASPKSAARLQDGIGPLPWGRPAIDGHLAGHDQPQAVGAGVTRQDDLPKLVGAAQRQALDVGRGQGLAGEAPIPGAGQ